MFERPYLSLSLSLSLISYPLTLYPRHQPIVIFSLNVRPAQPSPHPFLTPNCSKPSDPYWASPNHEPGRGGAVVELRGRGGRGGEIERLIIRKASRRKLELMYSCDRILILKRYAKISSHIYILCKKKLWKNGTEHYREERVGVSGKTKRGEKRKMPYIKINLIIVALLYYFTNFYLNNPQEACRTYIEEPGDRAVVG